MNISTVEHGEELLKRATPGTWYARYAYKKEEELRQMTLIGATAAGHAIVPQVAEQILRSIQTWRER